MADYGHELVFGTFLTPQAANPESVVALAQLTERAGLELATFQDHPYQNAFLDTWTLMTWVAANTETLRIAPNVLNLPLRPPAVLARSAASLDLLLQGPVRARPRRRRVLGPDRRHGRPAPHAGRVGHRAQRGDRRHPPDVGRHHAPRRARGRRALHGQGRQARPGAGARDPDPPRRLQAADAAAHGREGRRLAAVAGVHAAGRLRARERAHRRGGGAGRPRPARDPAHAQRHHERRGRARRARARARLRHVHPRERRPVRDRALRAGGRARGARGRRGRARAAGDGHRPFRS